MMNQHWNSLAGYELYKLISSRVWTVSSFCVLSRVVPRLDRYFVLCIFAPVLRFVSNQCEYRLLYED
uniref:Uncharacterized protein n=1 Tax=Romanomermis culicivorax TaxID=13658 RepID=A0A915I1W6_ROMCU